ncbi:MAG: hypothetical protein KGL39_34300 [Patescibacteria group bacterium]|nr:hypothetical protein [Patescibacteria group bacterium]
MSAAPESIPDDIEALARYFIIISLRDRDYYDKKKKFGHQLLLWMEKNDVKVLHIANYEIRYHPAKRKSSSCYQCSSILSDNNQPARLSWQKREIT